MKCSELLRILLRDGWYIVSQAGSHLKLRHEVNQELLFSRIMEVKKWVRDLKKRY